MLPESWSLWSCLQLLVVSVVFSFLALALLSLIVLLQLFVSDKMSVLLTASRRAVTKNTKPKKKKKSRPARFNPTPPLSSDHTAVWHWGFGDSTTTVMLSKERNEVWCNGTILDTLDGFTENEECDGAIIDFCITPDNSDSPHKARIQRTRGQYNFEYQLFVDGFLIQEHTADGMELQMEGMQLQMEGAIAPNPFEEPPSYEEAVGCTNSKKSQ